MRACHVSHFSQISESVQNIVHGSQDTTPIDILKNPLCR